MTYTAKPGTGVLFKNDKKDAEHAHRPDYRGSVTLQDGSTLNLGGWISENANGKYLSLKVSAVLPPVSELD